MQSNEAGQDSEHDYEMEHHRDMDGKELFYNQVDCSGLPKDVCSIVNFASHIWRGRADVLLAIYGAGSEYPQCFLALIVAMPKRRSSRVKLMKFLAYVENCG